MDQALQKIHDLKKDYQKEIIEACEHNLYAFAQTVNPAYLYGDIHKDVFSWLSDPEANERQLLLLPRGHLKALSVDSDVLTPSGWKKNGDLEIGDEVIGSDGLSTRITAVHPIGDMDLYRVRTRDGREVECNLDHLWTVQVPSNTGDKLVTKTTRELLSMYKSKRFDKRSNKEYEECRVFLPTVQPIEFSEKDLPIDPYTLGAWLGDGTSQGAEFTTIDLEILSYFPYRTKKWSKKYSYGVQDGFRAKLREADLLNNKHIPEQYFWGSIQQRLSLLQGLMDTDGTVHVDGHISYFTNINRDLIDGVQRLVRSLGGSTFISDIQIQVNDQPYDYQTISVKLPNGLNPFRLKRKAEKLTSQFDTKSAIVDISYSRTDLGRCITVQNEDGLYVTNDYILTHNSHCIAVFCVWKITFEPWNTIIYLCSQEDLAKAQLYAIKSIMTSDIYTMLWPEMFSDVRGVKGERGVWSAFAFEVDHPERRNRGVRDLTVQVKTVKANAQGLHCDGLVFDDVVVPQFADSIAGRSELSRALGYFSSILNPGGWIKAVGTRYHPEDAYESMIKATIPVWDEEIGDFRGEAPAWSTLEHVVEDSPNRSGQGNYLWPRTESPIDGRKYGFDARELAKIRADYVSHQGLVHFYSQYYNDPNDVGTQRISKDLFQYYDPKYLQVRNDKVFYHGNKLNVFAAMDVAWTETDRSDYTAIAVIGIDSDGFIYVLDLDRFRTSDFLTYYERIKALQHQWFFRRLLVETNAAGFLIAQEVENHVRRNGGSLVVERRAAVGRTGSKFESWAAVLEPRYHSKSVFHRGGGLTPTLEEELISAKPRHDDLKDALCAAISIATPPASRKSVDYDRVNESYDNVVHGRFGGRVRVR